MTDRRRLELHRILCEILNSHNVYFQPPENLKMEYPAIKYERDDISNTYADNKVYFSKRRYSVTVIDKDPDSIFVGRVSALPTASFNRHYKSDNLNHDVFTLYF